MGTKTQARSAREWSGRLSVARAVVIASSVMIPSAARADNPASVPVGPFECRATNSTGGNAYDSDHAPYRISRNVGGLWRNAILAGDIWSRQSVGPAYEYEGSSNSQGLSYGVCTGTQGANLISRAHTRSDLDYCEESEWAAFNSERCLSTRWNTVLCPSSDSSPPRSRLSIYAHELGHASGLNHPGSDGPNRAICVIAPEERDDPGFDAAIMCQGSPQIDLGPYDRSCVDRIDWDDAYSFRWNRLDRVHRVPLGGAAGSWVSDGPLDWEHSTGGSDNLANMRVSAAAPLLTALVNLTEVIDQSRDAQSLGLYFDSAGRAPIYRDEDPVPAWGLAMPRLEFPSILTLRPEYVDAIYFQNPDPSVDHGPWLNPVDETPHLLPLSNPWTGAAPRGSEADLWYSFRPATLCGGAPCPGYTARPIATMSAPSVAWTQAPGIPNATLIAWVNQLRPGSFRCSSDEAFGELMPGDPACPTERADVIPDPADHVNPRMGAGDGEVVILLRDATRQVPDQIFRLSDQVDNELSHETWDASRFTAATNVSVACSDYPWTLSGVEYRCLVAMVEREIPFDQSPHLAYRQVVHVYPIAFTEMGSSSAGLPLADDQGNTVLRIVLPIDTRPDENGDVKPLRHWTCPSDLILDDFYASCLTDEGEISGSDVAITYVPSPFLSAGRGRFFLFFKRATAGEPVVAYRANVPLHDNGPITWNFDGIVSSDSAMPWVQSRSRPDVPLVLP